MASLVIGRRRIKLRFFLFMALVILGIYYVLTVLQPDISYTSIEYGKVILEDSGSSILVRDETLGASSAYGKIVHTAPDGTLVNEGQTVAILYKENYDENIMYDLYGTQEKIVQYQQGRLTDQVLDSDISSLNTDIENLIRDIQTLIKTNHLDSIEEQEVQLRKLYENKQKLLDLRIEPDSYLTSLYEKEAELLSKVDDLTINISTPVSGYISYTLDGYENMLASDSLDKITFNDFNQILNNVYETKGKEIAEAEQPLFRVINPNSNWFTIIQVNNLGLYCDQGDKLNVTFENGEQFEGIAKGLIKEGKGSLLVIEYNSNIEKFLNRRIIPLKVQKTVEGLRIPENAIYNNKGKLGVYVFNSEDDVFVEIAIKGKAGGYAIVEAISDNQVLGLHDKVRIDN